MARMAPSELSTIPAVRRRDKRVVAQWFTVDIAAVEYTQTQIQLAVGEPLRIAHKHRPLNSEWPPLGAGQQIVSRSGRVNDEDSTTTIIKDLLPCRWTAFPVCVQGVPTAYTASQRNLTFLLQWCNSIAARLPA